MRSTASSSLLAIMNVFRAITAMVAVALYLVYMISWLDELAIC